MNPRICARIALALSLTLGAFQSRSDANEETAPKSRSVIHQLRIYEIFEQNKQAFHDRFRAHAMRIMTRYDFRIVSIWESKLNGRTEFVYVLEWPDRATMTDRWARFMADKEWADIKKESAKAHGALVGEIQDRVLDLTEYSPSTRLLPRKR